MKVINNNKLSGYCRNNKRELINTHKKQIKLNSKVNYFEMMGRIYYLAEEHKRK